MLTPATEITIKPWVNRASSPQRKKMQVVCGRDKSLTHRAIMFGSMASGHSTIHQALLGADCWATIHAFRALGVGIDVNQTASTITINSNGMAAFTSPSHAIDCANSGTTARLLIGLLAGIDGLKVTLIGDESLSKRPMDRVIEPLRAMGAIISMPSSPGLLPVIIEGGQLKPASIHVDRASAQVKSAILLAACSTPGCTSITLPKGSRDHTERLLRAIGADCAVTDHGAFEIVSMSGPAKVPTLDVTIPVDPSSTAFFAVLCAIHPGSKILLPDTLANETRCGYLNVLQRMGVSMISHPAAQRFIEDAVDLTLSTDDHLTGTTISPNEIPTLIDEIPILAVAAAFARSSSEFCKLGELRVKESDRLKKTYELLTLAGAEAKIMDDNLLIKGGLSYAKPFRFDPDGDHRLAMAAAVLATRSTDDCQILNPACVSVSFPSFFEVITSL